VRRTLFRQLVQTCPLASRQYWQ